MNSENAPRAISQAGLDLIKKHEGLRLEAYLCPAGKLTIGYGHTGDVQAGERITQGEAETLLQQDLRVFCRGVERLVQQQLNDSQFSALVSFTYNVGLQAFYRSSLLNLLNRGWYAQVPAQFMRWTKAGGRELPGLVRRRRDEAILWNRG
jgi:lysozyme